MANYINKKELETEVLLSIKEGKLTSNAVKMLMKMVREISRQMRYKYEEDKKDCIAEAYFDVLKYWNRYNPDKPNANCFSYFSQLCKNGLAKGFKKIRPVRSTQFISLSINDSNLNI